MKLLRPLVLALLLAPAVARAEDLPGFKGELLRNIDGVASKITELAATTPQDKYAYRPEDGVRSTAEVFLHIANANYLFPSMMGVKTPQGIDAKTLEKSTTDKAEIKKILDGSFEHVRKTVRELPDNDWDRAVDMFGRKTTLRDVCLTMIAHMHEHLGQSIAYARANHITPPWTARAQEKEKQKEASN